MHPTTPPHGAVPIYSHGLYGSWKSWKILEFQKEIQPWEIMERLNHVANVFLCLSVNFNLKLLQFIYYFILHTFSSVYSLLRPRSIPK